MEVQDGDIVFLERRVKFSAGQWVDKGANTFGHVEICSIDEIDGAEKRDEETVTKWLETRARLTRPALVIARARVYRSRAPASDRQFVAAAVDYLAHGATFGIWGAVTSVFRSKKATCRGLSGKYFERAVRLWQDQGNLPAHVMKRAFCSELVVTATQLGAMLAVAPLLGGIDSKAVHDDTDKLVALAKQHRLWLDTRAKATTPSGLERILRSSANWDYLGLYTNTDAADAADFIRLKSAIVRALAHYDDRTTMGVFKWTSTATIAALPVLRWLTTSRHPEVAPGRETRPGKTGRAVGVRRLDAESPRARQGIATLPMPPARHGTGRKRPVSIRHQRSGSGPPRPVSGRGTGRRPVGGGEFR
jgi:hypothetical protein